jgi:quinone-modifying oxidoreductase subunit QmoC
VEIFKHNRFKECTTNTDRVRGHLPLMLAFVGLFIVTSWSLVKQDILGLIWPSLHGPLPLTDPFKILANISAIALIFGTWVLWSSRTKSESEGKTSRTFYDWFLLWMIMAVGVTGLGAQVLRWINLGGGRLYHLLRPPRHGSHALSLPAVYQTRPYRVSDHGHGL